MTLNQLRYFQAIAQCGSMGRAAKQLFISQPSLSVSIDKLEEELSLTLFDRIGHHLELTREGRIFLDHAEKILSETEEALRHMEALHHNQDTLLRLGCIDPTLVRLVPSLMRRFLSHESNRRTRFELFTDTSPALIERLINGSLDLVLCSVGDAKGICQKEIASLPLALIAPADEIIPDKAPAASSGGASAAHGAGFKPAKKPASWEEIAALPLIGYIPNTAMDHLLHQISGEEQVNLTFRYRAPNEEAIAGLVMHGFGFGIVPMTEPLMANPHVTLLPLPGKAHNQTIYLTTLANHVYRGAAARFIKFLEEETALEM